MNDDDFFNTLLADVIVETNISEHAPNAAWYHPTVNFLSTFTRTDGLHKSTFKANKYIYYKFANLLVKPDQHFVISWYNSEPTFSIMLLK